MRLFGWMRHGCSCPRSLLRRSRKGWYGRSSAGEDGRNEAAASVTRWWRRRLVRRRPWWPWYRGGRGVVGAGDVAAAAGALAAAAVRARRRELVCCRLILHRWPLYSSLAYVSCSSRKFLFFFGCMLFFCISSWICVV
uniref:Expressed protein n=2 Tax=Oryza sativa subsp. japonica TaxID=39947 RepID=Q84ST7_ORYSJ|nr:expressed protein [Oryza sativa Japonica Group]